MILYGNEDLCEVSAQRAQADADRAWRSADAARAAAEKARKDTEKAAEAADEAKTTAEEAIKDTEAAAAEAKAAAEKATEEINAASSAAENAVAEAAAKAEEAAKSADTATAAAAKAEECAERAENAISAGQATELEEGIAANATNIAVNTESIATNTANIAALQTAIEGLEGGGSETVTVGDRDITVYAGGLLADLGTFTSGSAAEAFAARADICGTYTFMVFRMENSNNIKTAFMLNLLYNTAKSARQEYWLGKDKWYRDITGIQDALAAGDPTATTATGWTTLSYVNKDSIQKLSETATLEETVAKCNRIITALGTLGLIDVTEADSTESDAE